MNKKLLLWSIVVALGGFLFGFDTAVISGAEQQIQKFWQLSDFLHGQVIAIALYGTVVGAIFGGIPAEKFGRKKVLMAIGIAYIISSIGSAVSNDVVAFMLFRLLGGLAVGASSVVAPMYIAEIAPAKTRGQLVAAFQFNIVFGILIAYLSNFLIQNLGSDSWRLMLGIMVIPSVLFFILMFLVPESPRWLLVHKNDWEGARKTLEVSDPEGAEEALQSIKLSIEEVQQKVSLQTFFSSKYKTPVLMAFLIAAFNQLSGINAIIYFAPRVFEMAGIEQSAAFLQSAGIGLVNLIFTLIGLSLIDKLGRKTLLFIGSFGYIFSLVALAATFYFHLSAGILVPILVFVFIAAHAIGQGTVIWVFISEIFPNEVRSFGQSFGSSVHWVLAAIITSIFPLLANSFGPAVLFLFFGLMMGLQLIWVIFKMPETKGVSLENMQASLKK
jgi:sugar porter (SP) family MFS transporter